MSPPKPTRRPVKRPSKRDAVATLKTGPKRPSKPEIPAAHTPAPFGKVELIDRAGEASWAPDWIKALLPGWDGTPTRDFNAVLIFENWSDTEFDGTDQFWLVGAGSACPLPPRTERRVRIIRLGDSRDASNFWHVSVSHALVGFAMRAEKSKYAWRIECYGPYHVVAARDLAGGPGTFDVHFIPVCFAEARGDLLAASLPKPMFGYHYSYEDIFHWIPEALRALLSIANFVELRAGPPEPVRGYVVADRGRRIRIHVRDEHFVRALAWLRANGVGDGWIERHGPLSAPVWRPDGVTTERKDLIFRAWWPAKRDVERLTDLLEKSRAQRAADDEMKDKARALVDYLRLLSDLAAAKAELARRLSGR